MSLFDADMIDDKSQKSAPDDRRFCYNSLSETQNSASAAMHRCQEGHDMLSMRNCAFRLVIRGKIGVATTHPDRGQKSKRAVFQQPQYDFWMRSKWSKMACWSIGNRKSGCGCSAGAISADSTSKKWVWLLRGAFVGDSGRPGSGPVWGELGRCGAGLGAIWGDLGAIWGDLGPTR